MGKNTEEGKHAKKGFFSLEWGDGGVKSSADLDNVGIQAPHAHPPKYLHLALRVSFLPSQGPDFDVKGL